MQADQSLLSAVWVFVQDDQGHCSALYGYLCRMIRVTVWRRLITVIAWRCMGICAGRSESLLSSVWVFVQDDQGHCSALYGYLCRMIRVTAWRRPITVIAWRCMGICAGRSVIA